MVAETFIDDPMLGDGGEKVIPWTIRSGWAATWTDICRVVVSLAPALSMTVRRTVYVPATL